MEKRTVVVHGRVGVNLSPCQGNRGGFISSFYDSNEEALQLQLFDVLHSVNDDDVLSLPWEEVCARIVCAHRPFLLTVARKKLELCCITLRHFNHIATSSEVAANDANEWVTMHELEAIERLSPFSPKAQELLELRFAADPSREARLESAFERIHLPAVAASFFHDDLTLDSSNEVISFLPTLIESLPLLFYVMRTAPDGEVRMVRDPELRRVLFALHWGTFLKIVDPVKLMAPMHLSIHRVGPYQTQLLEECYKKSAVLELLTSKSLCVLLCALLQEISVTFVYSSSTRNSASVADLLRFLDICIRPLVWCHLSDPVASCALLGSPFPFLCGVQRNVLDDENTTSLSDDVLIFDLEFSVFNYPLPSAVSRGLHVFRGLQREIDVMLRPHFHNNLPSGTKEECLSSEDIVDRILQLAGTFIRERLTNFLSPSSFFFATDPSGPVVVLDEKLFMENAGNDVASADFHTQFLRTQHVSNLLVTL